ncbi:MAG: beta-propeller domain-containing protein [Clostridia bacterium]|nr:beta-propeller domain-containing protein [Clostridia bacterium]
MGEKAYVVTFKNTDPLFAIDLSDPKNPTILGELKLPGYSAYLHPISENLLIGIGYDGDANNADFSTIKVSLFDISNPTELKELDNVVISDATTTVSYNPKAMIYNSAEGIIGLPVNGGYNSYGDEYSYYLIRVQESGLEIMHKLLHSKGSYVNIESFRGTYIGDKFFTVSDYAVKKFNFADGKELTVWTNSEGVNLVGTTAAYENKDIADIDDNIRTTIMASTQSTSKGYAVDEPDTTAGSGVTGQTTPPYNPNN